MSRESAEVKGRRYLLEARLLIEQVDRDLDYVRATCRGSGTVHELGHDGRGWWCTCLARGRCSHLVALQLVTVARKVAA